MSRPIGRPWQTQWCLACGVGGWPHDVQDPDGGFAVSLWDSLEAMQAYEQSAVFRQEIQPTLQPFFVGEYTTYRCEVKYEQ
jgi:heme-degrading monooxygenase HmoA